MQNIMVKKILRKLNIAISLFVWFSADFQVNYVFQIEDSVTELVMAQSVLLSLKVNLWTRAYKNVLTSGRKKKFCRVPWIVFSTFNQVFFEFF